MKSRFAVGIAVGLAMASIFAPTRAADLERGKLLYETFCVSCHDESVHARKERLAKSRSRVEAQVARWQENIGLKWNKSEIEDVAAYLSRAVYRFE
jgi:mono/diheme cytochrome c family protein